MQSQGRLQEQMSMSRLNRTYFGNHHCGVGGKSFVDAPKKKPFDIPQIKWKCPPKVLLNPSWLVAAGEGSEEAKTQKLREARMLDTAHPYPYDTCSPGPCDVPDHLSDCDVPLIPLIPVEENEEVIESDMVVPEVTSHRNPILPNSEPAVDADVIAAAAVVMTAIMKSKEEGSLIDTDLLIKLLSDPQMMQKLMNVQEDVAKASTVEEVNGEAGEPCKPEFASKPIQEDSKPEPVNEDVTNDHGLVGEPEPEPKPVVLANPNTDPRFGNSTRKMEVTPGLGAAQYPGPYPATSSTSLPITRSNPVLTYGNDVPDHGRIGSVSLGMSHMPLPSFPSPKPDISKTGVPQVSGPYPVTSSASLPIPRSNPVNGNFTHGHGAPDHGRIGPISLGMSHVPLPSFPSPKSDISKTGAPQVSGPYPMTSSASLPIPRSNPVVENFTYGNGVPDLRRSGPGSVWNSQIPSPSFPSPKPDLSKMERQVSLPNLNLTGVGFNRFPPPNLADTCFQLEPFSPSSRMPNSTAMQNVAPGLNFLHLPNTAKPNLHVAALSPNSVQIPPFSGPPVKDVNYFKNLIRKHGEIQETVNPNQPKTGNPQHVSSLDVQLLTTLNHNRPPQRVPKPCVYFNGPKGCRNGSNCSFRHDVPEAPDAKRMKLSR